MKGTKIKQAPSQIFDEQVADLLTKAVTVQVFQKLRGQMGIETVANMI
jgi:hypothetical protein